MPISSEIHSVLASMSPSTLHLERTLFAVLKAYHDGSVTRGRFMTLACIGAHDSIWKHAEIQWDNALQRHGASYMHMKEALPLVDGFRGWTKTRRNDLLDDLISVLHGLRVHQDRLTMLTCSVDLA